MKYYTVVLAAGNGKRMKAGKNKLLLELDGIPLIFHCFVSRMIVIARSILWLLNQGEMKVLWNRFSQNFT